MIKLLTGAIIAIAAVSLYKRGVFDPVAFVESIGHKLNTWVASKGGGS